MRRESRRPSSEHDVFTKSDMSDMTDLSADCLKVGGQGILLFSELQFLSWIEALESIKKSVTLEDADGQERTQE